MRERGRRVSDRLLVLGALETGLDASRFGLAVSKRVGGSVTRNRVKRRLRESVRSLELRPGFDVVVSARPAAAEADYHGLRSSLARLARRAGLLVLDDAGPSPHNATGTGTEKPDEKCAD